MLFLLCLVHAALGSPSWTEVQNIFCIDKQYGQVVMVRS